MLKELCSRFKKTSIGAERGIRHITHYALLERLKQPSWYFS